ncbi:Trehalose utilization [Novipirellula aureliae]|uniref:Trehalose utilization n=1 Tax=Novipirellula aureliae TaxID=2527966 RepID=A0A5C6E9Y4_9BACT|nr:ThuA domain-containing protein [Novipirellula aureliae]TWU45314.1 Trehalose utilization [Novipirellula aureliae]
MTSLQKLAMAFVAMVGAGLSPADMMADNTRADIRVLIVDGFSNHSVEKTTQKIQQILASDATFKVTVSTMPEFKSAQWASWNPKFTDYDVIIQTCNNIGKTNIVWPDTVKSNLESYLKDGGGMYVYHSANNAFADWDEYNKMIGMGWRAADFGKALEVKDGRLVEIPAGVGKKTGHGPRIDAVFHRFGDHPIHVNLPQSWKSADVEVYAYARGPLQNLTVLSYAREPVNDMDFPTEWVVQYGKGRVYSSTYGHYWKNQDNPKGVQDVAFQTILIRALQWLARSPVTETVPANFPTRETISLQNVPPDASLDTISP